MTRLSDRLRSALYYLDEEVAYHYTAEDARRLARLGPIRKRKQR